MCVQVLATRCPYRRATRHYYAHGALWSGVNRAECTVTPRQELCKDDRGMLRGKAPKLLQVARGIGYCDRCSGDLRQHLQPGSTEEDERDGLSPTGYCLNDPSSEARLDEVAPRSTMGAPAGEK